MGAPIDFILSQAARLIQESGHRRTFLILDGPLVGQTFHGMLEPKDMFDPAMPLGKDQREHWQLAINLKPNSTDPWPRFRMNDGTTQSLFGNLQRNFRIQEPTGEVWKITDTDGPDYIDGTFDVVKSEAIDT